MFDAPILGSHKIARLDHCVMMYCAKPGGRWEVLNEFGEPKNFKKSKHANFGTGKKMLLSIRISYAKGPRGT